MAMNIHELEEFVEAAIAAACETAVELTNSVVLLSESQSDADRYERTARASVEAIRRLAEFETLLLRVVKEGVADTTLDAVREDTQAILALLEQPVVANVEQPANPLDEDEEPVETPYGVRVETGEGIFDLDNVLSVMVYDKRDESWPFAFAEIDTVDEAGNVTGSNYRPGFIKPEDGTFEAFSAAEAPKPNDGW